MDLFKTFIVENRLIGISPKDEQEAKKLIREFQLKYNTPEKIKRIKQLARIRRVPIGEITVFDYETKQPQIVTVYISRNEPAAHYKHYDPWLKRDRIIVLNYLKALNSYDPEDVLIYLKHEIRHAIQQYKNFSKNYTKHLGKKKGFESPKYYYGEPAELDAQETELFLRLRDYVKKIENVYGLNTNFYNTAMNRFKHQLNQFLIKPFDMVKNNLPRPLNDKIEMIETLSEIPKLWKRFKLKIKTFLDNLHK